jgi:hypothetical protein
MMWRRSWRRVIQARTLVKQFVRVEARQHFCLIPWQGSGWVFVTPLYGDTASLRGKKSGSDAALLNRAVLHFSNFQGLC